MDLVEIDVMRAEPLQRGVDRLHDVLARQALGVGARPHLPMHLGRDDDVVALGVFLERPAEDLLARALRIDVGGVEEVDPALERLADERPRRLFLEHPFAPLGRAVGHAAEADFRHLHAGLAELRGFHGMLPSLGCAHHRTFRRTFRNLSKARAEGPNERERGGWDFWIDRGGTFTDVIGRDPAGACMRKNSCRRARPTRTRRSKESAACSASPEGEPIPAGAIGVVKMGTTVATNALLERRGERTLLVTTRGFRDALEIGYQARPKIFARNIEKPEQLYSEVVEIDERVLADGTVEAAPDPHAVRTALAEAKAQGLRRGRDRLHARLSLSGARARGRRDRPRPRLRPGVGKPRLLGADQARVARRHDGGRRLSVADPRPLCRARVARARGRADGRESHVHDVVGRPDLGQAVRRQGRDPVRAGRRRGGDGAHRPRARASSASSASTWAAPRPTSPTTTAHSSAPSRPKSPACGCARRC